MADPKEGECNSKDIKELTAQQKKNKKKKQAAKKKKQENRERNDALSESSDINSEENQCQENKSPQEKFDDELAWCISQLEIGLTRQKPDKNTAQQTENIIKNLKSPKTPLPKKRQIMFSVFGDYRKKIQDDKKKLQTIECKTPIKVFPVSRKQHKSVFLRVSRNNQEIPEEDMSEISERTSWKFESSTEDFRFNFNKPE